MNKKYEAVESTVLPRGTWDVGAGGDVRFIASFYGPTAEQDAKAYADTLNAREPVVELPTEPGHYTSVGWLSPITLFPTGSWYFNGEKYDEDWVRNQMPLERLVPESKVRELRAQAVESVPSSLLVPNDPHIIMKRAAEIRAEDTA